MNSITIISIVVVALLTILIFGLSLLAYRACIKTYRLEVNQGLHDDSIKKEYCARKFRKGGLIGLLCSYTVLFALSAVFITGIVYKAKGENITINNQTVLVIKSGSMSDFYNDKIAQKYNYDTSLHFDIGDICIFEKVTDTTELVQGDIYGYRYKNIIITHRLIGTFDDGYQFRGDNNPVSDKYLVQREAIYYHYLGKKIPGIGSFILFSQSYFGIWAIVSIIGVAVTSEIVYHKIEHINKERAKSFGDICKIEPKKVKKKNEK